jgi:hypothetical protein
MPLAYPFTVAAMPYVDNGLGYALKTEDGKYFCGFRDWMGRVVYNGLEQKEPFNQKTLSEKFVMGEPVFMTPADMQDRNLQAIVYPSALEALIQEDYRTTAKAAGAGKGAGIPSFIVLATVQNDFPNQGASPNSIVSVGLATPQSCDKSGHGSYVHSEDSLKYAARVINRNFKKLTAAFSEAANSGFAVKTIDGRFFCGYKQNDGVIFDVYKQVEKMDGVTTAAEPVFKTGEAVFLYPYQMKEREIRAAVYPAHAKSDVAVQLQAADLKFCKFVAVKKNTTSPAHAVQTGLADADACLSGKDKGFASAKDALTYGLRRVKQSVGLK